MANDLFTAGVWGVILTEENIGAELLATLDPKTTPGGTLEQSTKAAQKSREVRAALFERVRLRCPLACRIFFSGYGDDRPGRCLTPIGCFLFGIGQCESPWEWPRVSDSFVEAAELHTWAFH